MRLSAALSLLLLLSACGPTSVKDAQTSATRAACDYYDKCGEIGAAQGSTFEDRQECEVKVRDSFQSMWPADSCTAINEEGLDTCLARIRTTTCDNTLDFFTTLSICSKDNVCKQ